MRDISTLSRRLKQCGQGMTEYIIIVALVAIAAIGVYSFFGQTVRQQPAPAAGAGQEPTGKPGSKEPAGAQTATGQPAGKAAESKGAGDPYK